MSGQVPVVSTPISMRSFCHALVRGWPESDTLSPRAAAVVWAQYMVETGGKACWNYNLGNVKHVDGDGYDWVALRGVFEFDSRGKRYEVPVSSPAARFRAYPSLAEAMREHLAFLRNKRYVSAWPFVVDGDVVGFATSLRRAGYFTASAEAYAKGMLSHFEAFLASDVYFHAVGARSAEQIASGVTKPPDEA